MQVIISMIMLTHYWKGFLIQADILVHKSVTLTVTSSATEFSMRYPMATAMPLNIQWQHSMPWWLDHVKSVNC